MFTLCVTSFLRKGTIVDWQHLFVAWGLWWWLLTLAFLVGSFAMVAWKRGAYFLISLVVYLGLVQFLAVRRSPSRLLAHVVLPLPGIPPGDHGAQLERHGRPHALPDSAGRLAAEAGGEGAGSNG